MQPPIPACGSPLPTPPCRLPYPRPSPLRSSPKKTSSLGGRILPLLPFLDKCGQGPAEGPQNGPENPARGHPLPRGGAAVARCARRERRDPGERAKRIPSTQVTCGRRRDRKGFEFSRHPWQALGLKGFRILKTPLAGVSIERVSRFQVSSGRRQYRKGFEFSGHPWQALGLKGFRILKTPLAGVGSQAGLQPAPLCTRVHPGWPLACSTVSSVFPSSARFSAAFIVPVPKCAPLGPARIRSAPRESVRTR
jgi:hypothetical protein